MAFTLIELLTVIAIIGILAAILVPTVSRVRKSANAVKSQANLRQLGAAFLTFSAEHRDKIPAYISEPWGQSVASDSLPPHPFRCCWAWWLLPYVGMPVQGTAPEPGLPAEGLFFAANDSYYGPRTDGLPRRSYSMPIGESTATSGPIGNRPARPWIGPLSKLRAPSKTILLTERFGGMGTVGGAGWSDVHTSNLAGEMLAADNGNGPTDNPYAGTNVNGGRFNFLFCDGHVELLKLESTVTFPGEFGSLSNPKGMWIAYGL